MSDRQSPLSSEEAELARALRGLPISAPAARIDAEILAAARTSVQRRSPVRRPWIWSLGTAAAAVLAFGTLLRLQHSGLEPIDETRVTFPGEVAEEVRQTTGRSEQALQSAPTEGRADEADSARLDRIEVSGTRIVAEPVPMAELAEMAVPPPPAAPPPPPAPPAVITPRPEAFPPSRSVAAPAPRPAPPQAPPAVHREAPVIATESPAPALRSTAAPRTSDSPKAAQRERGVTVKQQASKSSGDAVALDAEGEIDSVASQAPHTLFSRVRELLDAGENKHARDLLRAWHRAHPDYPLPDDLRVLLE